MDETATPVKRPRFPVVAAALCAACVGAAVWTWMRYSYCWDMAPSDGWSPAFPDGMFVRVHGVVKEARTWEGKDSGRFAIVEEGRRGWVFFPFDEARTDDGTRVAVKGRIRTAGLRDVFGLGIYGPELDTSTSRFTGASIAGLAVGAMGVFVFALYLRNWLKERRAAG